MKLGVDLLALQASTSRSRGIGAYSAALLRALLRRDRIHDLSLLLHRDLPPPSPGVLPPSTGRHAAAAELDFDEGGHADPSTFPDRLGERVASLGLDAIHFTSPFETARCAVAGLTGVATFATVYDIIPHLNRAAYLDRFPEGPRDRYDAAIRVLPTLDRLLTISEHVRQDLLANLPVDPDRVVTIGCGVESRFRVRRPHDGFPAFRRRMGLEGPFVMVPGGGDPRKNLSGSLAAFAGARGSLPPGTKLAMVFSLTPEEQLRLSEEAAALGLGPEVVFTDFVDDETQVDLYNAAEAVLFPSFIEGFGLPAAEAQACGTPVVTSNRTSLPEATGGAALVVDPEDRPALARALVAAVCNEPLRADLVTRGLAHARTLTWDRVAERWLAVVDDVARGRRGRRRGGSRRARVAWISPVLPTRSGVAAYTAQVVPALGKHAEVTLLDDASLASLPDRRREFDRVVYQMGDSAFHRKAYTMATTLPGHLVLHDLCLAGMLFEWATAGSDPAPLRLALDRSRLADPSTPTLDDFFVTANPTTLRLRPLVEAVVESSSAVACHSSWAAGLVRSRCPGRPVSRLPLTGPLPPSSTGDERLRARADARGRLRIPEGRFTVGVFGHAAFSKRVESVLAALALLRRGGLDACLAVVGQVHPPSPGFFPDLPALAGELGVADAVTFTGFVDDEDFATWAAAVDVGANLRHPVVGESSGVLLQLLAAGLPCLVTPAGSFLEYPDECCWKVEPDEHEVPLLVAYLTELARSPRLRAAMADHAVTFARRNHGVEGTVEAYLDFLELG